MRRWVKRFERGASMVEVAVALGITLIALTGAAQLLSFGFRSASSSAYITIAVNAARAKIEEMKGVELSRVPIEYPDGSTYAVGDLPNGTLRIEYPEGTAADPLPVLITVEWTERGVGRSVRLATMLGAR